MRALIRHAIEDVEAALKQDPAARGRLEVALCYPGVHALWIHRVSHALWGRGLVLGPRILSHLGRAWTGVEIHPGARVGRGVFIDHGMGVVIGETAEVGDGCVLYKGVVLGGVSQARVRRHPRLGSNVVVGSNACILGAIDVGVGARIGSGSVVIRDVPDNATVVGVPGRIVRESRRLAEVTHADLPDPVADALRRLSQRVAQLEEATGHRPAPAVEGDDPFAGAVEGMQETQTAPAVLGPSARKRR
ncbi:MAG: serine O-acetyltransferase [Deltaproteobacteria bacterium]